MVRTIPPKPGDILSGRARKPRAKVYVVVEGRRVALDESNTLAGAAREQRERLQRDHPGLSEQEIEENPRAASVRLRAAERVREGEVA